MIRTLNSITVDVPLAVLGLLAIAHAAHDTQAEVRGWGDRQLLGNGVTAGDSHWSATSDEAQLKDGTRVPCIRLTKRQGFWTGNPATPVDYLIPFDTLRAPIGVEIVLAEAA